jgi:hypothetical protein
MALEQTDGSKKQDDKPFVSALGTGREGFHAEIIEYCLRVGERSAEDFIRHFSCAHIMKALESRPTERSRIVSEATGIHDKVAHKMSPLASGEALQIALDEKVTTPSEIVRLFHPDDRQRYLDRKALWKFTVEGQPWKATPSNKTQFERAKSYIAFVLNRALANRLLSHEELVSAITVQKMALMLPKDQLGAIIQIALDQKEKFSEEHLLKATPTDVLVQHIPLDYIWDRVVTPLIAERHEYVERATSATPSWTPAADENEVEVPSTPNPSAGASPTDVVGEDDITEDDVLIEDPSSPGASAEASAAPSVRKASSSEAAKLKLG